MSTLDAFLAKTGWDAATQTPLAGDASVRRYIRLCSDEKRAILMVDPQDDTDRFAAVAAYLSKIGLSAPTILHRANGLMLLEDLGDDVFARVIDRDPSEETRLYIAAVEVLAHLQATPVCDGIPEVTPDVLGEMIDPVFTHYAALLGEADQTAEQNLKSRLTDLLGQHANQPPVTVLRDFHAENMIWLPDREGVRRVGLLDFQDALAGPPAYDLVSMLQDARRDVSEACVTSARARYLELTGETESALLTAFHLLGLQRNLRIIGVFARLATVLGKPHYLSLIPRVWGHIETSLAHPVAATLRPSLIAQVPEPTPERLAKLGAP